MIVTLRGKYLSMAILGRYKLFSLSSGRNVLLFSGLAMVMVDSSPQERERCSPAEMAQCTAPLTLVTDNSDLGWGSSRWDQEQHFLLMIDYLLFVDMSLTKCVLN